MYQKVSEMNKNPISEAWILKNPIFDNDHCQRLSNYKINIREIITKDMMSAIYRYQIKRFFLRTSFLLQQQ